MPYVEVWVEPEDASIDDLTDDELLDELEKRGLCTESESEILASVRGLLLANLHQDALLAIEKAMAPKVDRAAAYDLAKANRDHSGRPVIQ